VPRRLLREPHVLAHELRTPLAILAGWYSLVRDADISPERTPAEWARAMAACQEAVARLNLVISQACDEADSINRLKGPAYEQFNQLLKRTEAAISQSRDVLVQLQLRRDATDSSPKTAIRNRRTKPRPTASHAVTPP
jgi:signal transduction histidine kinase